MRISFAAQVGGICWLAAAPLSVIANAIVGSAWRDPRFDWTSNNISDLGNVGCGVWDTTRPRYVCSPWHDAMNVSFVVTAVLLLAGVILTWRAWGDGKLVRAAQLMAALGAIGWAMVGAFPADRNEDGHFLAGLLVFGLGNAGLILAGWVRSSMPLARLRLPSLGLGVVGVIGTGLFSVQQGAGMGLGTMERIAAWPLLVWACVAGGYLYRRSHSASAQSSWPSGDETDRPARRSAGQPSDDGSAASLVASASAAE